MNSPPLRECPGGGEGGKFGSGADMPLEVLSEEQYCPT